MDAPEAFDVIHSKEVHPPSGVDVVEVEPGIKESRILLTFLHSVSYVVVICLCYLTLP